MHIEHATASPLRISQLKQYASTVGGCVKTPCFALTNRAAALEGNEATTTRGRVVAVDRRSRERHGPAFLVKQFVPRTVTHFRERT